jgi:hypothetical protein
MSSAAPFLCLVGALLLGPGEDKVIYKAPFIKVLNAPATPPDAQNPDLRYNYLLHHTIYWGRNYLPPAARADRGNPLKDFSRLPTTYWHPYGPLGAALARFDWFRADPNTFHADARIVASLVGQAVQPYGPLAAVWSEPRVLGR